MAFRFTKVVFLLAFSICCVTHPLRAKEFRMGVLPVLDALPLHVGVNEGFFKTEGLDVKLVSFNSAMERNTAMHSGQIDGFFGDMLATLLLARNKVPVKFLTVTYATDPKQRMFGLMLSPDLPVNQQSGEIKVAISRASIIEYLLDMISDMPETEDFRFRVVEIKQMPLRLQMLLTGKIDAALLPEPLASLAESKGARLLATDQSLDIPLTVLNIHANSLSSRAAFLKAYAKAVEALNQRPEKYRALMAKTCRIPKPLVDSFPMYRYPAPRLPTENEVAEVQAWMIKKELLSEFIPYQSLIP